MTSFSSVTADAGEGSAVTGINQTCEMEWYRISDHSDAFTCGEPAEFVVGLTRTCGCPATPVTYYCSACVRVASGDCRYCHALDSTHLTEPVRLRGSR